MSRRFLQQSRVRVAFVPLLAVMLATTTGWAQESEPAPSSDPNRAGQTRDVFRQVQEGLPFVFFFDNPKKKKPGKRAKELLSRWTIVDLDARKAAQFAAYDQRIEEINAGTEDTDDVKEAKIEEIETRRIQLQNFYDKRKLTVESRSNPDKEVFYVDVERTTIDKRSLDQVQAYKANIEQNWTAVKWINEGSDTTSGRDKSAQRTRATLEFIGTSPNGERQWTRIEVIRAFAGPKKARVPYFATVISSAPEAKFGPKTAKEREAFHSVHLRFF